MKNIFIIGDSTTSECTKEEYPQQGWAHYLREEFCDDVNIINCGHAGNSLKSFLYSNGAASGTTNESEWDGILSQINSGDSVIFYWAGINDMLQTCADRYIEFPGGEYVRDFQNTSCESYIKIGKGLGTHKFFTYTSTIDEYKEMFTGMLEDIKKKGACVIAASGTGKYYKIGGDDKNVISVVREYTHAVRDAAAAAGAAFIDVGTEFEREFLEIGYDEMLKKYFLSKEAYAYYSTVGEVTRKVPAVDDNVHYNLEGARHVCKIFVDKLRTSGHELSKYLK